jgi:hypothetical protein
VPHVVSPAVVRETRRQFGCDTAIGAALEGEGGTGSAGAHWEYRWFQGDLMVATNLFSVYGRRATMSRVTLAFMEDSGWYLPFWDAAGHLDWGHEAGCDFIGQTCSQYVKTNPEQRFYCTASEWGRDVNSVCTFDHLARARCEDTQFGDGCVMRVAMGSSPNCLDPRYETTGGNIFGWASAAGSRCVPVTWLFRTTTSGNGVEYQFPDASFKEGWRDAMCYKASCTGGGEGGEGGGGGKTQQKLQLDILGSKVDCPAGETVDLSKALPSKFQQGKIGPCPEAATVCGSLACGEACTAGGQCHEGKCYCDLEFTGKDCGKRLTASGGWEDYVPLPGGEDGGVVGGGGAGTSPFFPPGGASGYIIVAADLRNSQQDLLRSLDRYKSAVAGLAGVGVPRVSVISYTLDRPATSILGKKLRRRSLQASEDSGRVRVDSRVSTLSPQDAEAITARVKDPARLAKFGEELQKAGLDLVEGTVAVQSPAAGAGGGGLFGGLGNLFQGLGGSEAERIAIIVGVSVGAVVILSLLGWAVARAVRARRRRREEAAAAAAIARLNGGGGGGLGGGGRVPPLRGDVVGGAGPARYASSTSAYRSPTAQHPPQPQPQQQQQLFTVAGRCFTNRDDAEQYALALAVSRSLGEREPEPPASSLTLPPAAARGGGQGLASHATYLSPTVAGGGGASPSFVPASAPPPAAGRTPRTSGASGNGGGGAYPAVRF